MVLGHYGVAFAAKKITPRVPLPLLFIAAQLADILWPVFLITHIEKYAIVPGTSVVSPYDFIYYPWSHSLAMDIFWGLLLGILYYRITKYRPGAWMVGLVVVSHWVLDLIVHIPDLPLTPFSNIKLGFGGWNSFVFTIAIESIIFYGGVFIYWKATKAISAAGHWSLILLVLLLSALFFSTFSSSSGDGTPLMTIFIIFMVLQIVLILLSWWVDRTRKTFP
jgi:hypothetical protein